MIGYTKKELEILRRKKKERLQEIKDWLSHLNIVLYKVDQGYTDLILDRIYFWEIEKDKLTEEIKNDEKRNNSRSLS